MYTYSANPNGGAFDFGWTISGSGFNWGYSNTQPFVLVYWTSAGPDGYVELQSTNSCGTTYSTLAVTITQEGGCNPCQIVTPYPNPTSKELHVSIVELMSSAESKEPTIYQINLINNSSEVVYKTITRLNEVTIPTDGLEAGLYYLKVTDMKGNSTAKQVQILK